MSHHFAATTHNARIISLKKKFALLITIFLLAEKRQKTSQEVRENMAISATPKELSSSKASLQTERLILRAVQESDLDNFFEMFSNEDVMRYWYAILSSGSISIVQS